MTKQKHLAGSKKGPQKPRRAHGAKKYEKSVGTDSIDMIFGFHSTLEALKNPKRHHHRLFATQNAEGKLRAALPALPIEPTRTSPEDITKMLEGDAVHQGLLLQSAPLKAHHLEDIESEDLVVVLDQITDPHNIGAIMRSACAFGARFIIMTDRHAPGHNMTIAKAASGAREHVSLITVTNLARSIEALQKRGFVVVGLDSEADQNLSAPETRRACDGVPTALVLGAEGKGLRRLTRETCDILARIDAPGPIVSLNVSNAAALALYEITRKKTS